MEAVEEDFLGEKLDGFRINGQARDLRNSVCLGPGTLQTVQPREHLFLDGDLRKTCFEVVSGAIAIYRVQAGGRRQISRFVLPGDHMSLGWEAVEPSSAVATCTTRVLRRPIAAMRRAALANPATAHSLGWLQTEELRDINDLICMMAFGDAKERVAVFLQTLASRIGFGRDPVVVDLPMTRSDIGDHLGLTLETVSREISRLKRHRIIEIDRVTRLSILDPRRLAQLACGP